MISENRKNVTSLDKESKIRLLLTMINDEGHSKLKASLEKLLNRLKEEITENGDIIARNLHKQIMYLPLKSSIYATICVGLYTNNKECKEFIAEIINNLLRQLKLKNETSK